MESPRKLQIGLLAAGLIFASSVAGVVQAQVTVVACVGDSNTYGQNLPRSQAYPPLMEEILNRSGGQWEVHNFGVSGYTILRQGDLPYSTTRALAVKPDVVVFGFGVNATRSPNRGLIDDRYVSDYVDLVNEFSQLDPVPEIWICLPLAAQSSSFTASPTILEDKVVPYVQDVAAITGLPIIDLFSVFKEAPELYQGDGIHPTRAGSALMAEIIAATILGRRWCPDFNGDSKVDIKDLVNLIEHWGVDEPALDVAPPPFGDGIVDVQDVEVVMRYWEQDVNDPTLAAHWALDESVGDIALDAAGDNDAAILGGPAWKFDPSADRLALQLDGMDDHLETPLVLNPSNGPFTVFAWIQGGAPGQVIVSQLQGKDWLSVDAAGFLRTDLKGISRALALSSHAVITDGNWHRVGLTWDGVTRSLYADDALVAEDEPGNVPDGSVGLNIGCGASLEPGTFFSGLIDDVRIYNRAVKP